jgi:hypothetical protein
MEIAATVPGSRFIPFLLKALMSGHESILKTYNFFRIETQVTPKCQIRILIISAIVLVKIAVQIHRSEGKKRPIWGSHYLSPYSPESTMLWNKLLLRGIMCCALLGVMAQHARAQGFPGGYGPTYPTLDGYPWPGFLPPPPPLPFYDVTQYNSVPPIVPQNTPVTCWAAAMSNLFKFYGYDVPQNQIVTTLSPTGNPTLATPEMISSGMNRVWADQNGVKFRVSSNITSLFPGHPLSTQCDNNCVFTELKNGHPVLMGTTDHVMVIYAAMENAYGSAFMVWVNDPAPMPTPTNSNPFAPHLPRYIGTNEAQAYFIAAASVNACPANGAC